MANRFFVCGCFSRSRVIASLFFQRKSFFLLFFSIFRVIISLLMCAERFSRVWKWIWKSKVIEIFFFFFFWKSKKLRSLCECRCRTDICEQDSQTFGGGADHGTRHDPLCPRIASGKRRENSGRCHQEEGWMLCCVSCVVGILSGDLSVYHFFVD